MVNDNSLYNDDELHAPDWMNDEFFVKILKTKEAERCIKLTQLTITPGTTKSDHYASIMFRAKLNYTVEDQSGSVENKFQSLIIKTMPHQDGQKKELIAEMKLFETEIRMYSEALPKIEAILRTHGDTTQLCAGALYHTLEPRKCIVFEDLVEKGYEVISGRHANLAEVRAALLKLAKLHAVSYKLGKEGDSCVTSFRNGSFNSINVEEFAMARDAVKVFKAVLAEHEDLIEYIPHIEKIEKTILGDCVGYFNAYSNGERNGIFVLNHGDFHMKNAMIKKANGKLADFMLLDYQISFFGSAAVDLHYAFVMMMSPEMRLQHSDELVYYYIKHFQATLQLVGYTGHIPTVTEFRQELQKHKIWEFFLVISFMIFGYLFADPHGDIQKAVEDESYRRKFFENPAVLKEYRRLLPKYLHRGYFEN